MPDRRKSLRPWIIPTFKDAGVVAILHAGDVCIPSVIDQLNEVAPVYAVRGNRDWVALNSLPMQLSLEFEGVIIGLTHGHGGWRQYFLDKVFTVARGLHPERYLKRSDDVFPEAKVVVFGHTHVRVNEWIDGRLFFNPGSACCPHPLTPIPSIGLLKIDPGGHVSGEIILQPKK